MNSMHSCGRHRRDIFWDLGGTQPATSEPLMSHMRARFSLLEEEMALCLSHCNSDTISFRI